MLISGAIASEKNPQCVRDWLPSVLFGCLLALLKCSDEKVHIFDLGISPSGVREADRGWGEALQGRSLLTARSPYF